MTKFTINSTVFDALRNTTDINLTQLQKLVDSANRNPILNAQLTRIQTRDDAVVRVANGDELREPNLREAGAWFNYNPDVAAQNNDKYSVILRPDKLIGQNAGFGKTSAAELAHELDHYVRVEQFKYADSLKDLTVRPDLNPEQRFSEIVRVKMETEVAGWYTELRALRAEYNNGNPNGALPALAPIEGVQRLLLTEESRLKALGYQGDALADEMLKNGASILSRNTSYWDRYTSDLGGLGVSDPAAIRQQLAYRLDEGSDAIRAWEVVELPDGGQRLEIKYRDDRTREQTFDAIGNSNSVLKNSAGELIERRQSIIQPNGSTTTTTRDGSNNLVSTANNQIFDDGSTLSITDFPDGRAVVSSTVGDNDVTFAAAKDPTGKLFVTGITGVNGGLPDELTSGLVDAALVAGKFTPTDTVQRPGAILPLVEAVDPTNPTGATPTLVERTGRSDWWNDPRIGVATDAVSLISALRGGKPLPIATAGLNFASHILSDPAVGEIAAALSAVGSLKGLVDAIEKGDLGRILIDGGGVARSAITIYSNNLTQQMIGQYGTVFRAGELATQGNTAAAEIYNKGLATDNLLKELGQAIAVLNIINSLANGDIKGAIISAITLVNPVVGAIISAADVIFGLLFPNEHQFEAEGRYVGGPNGQITIAVDNVNGGAFVKLNDVMQALLDQTIKQATAIGVINKQPMGVIAERLPTIELKQDVMFLRYNDPLSNQSFVRTFDIHGKYLTPGRVENVLNSDQTSILSSPWGPNPPNQFVQREVYLPDRNADNQIAQSKIFFDSIAQQYSDAVTASGAIAPLWEVETVALQRLNGDPRAGWTTEQVADAAGTSYSPWTPNHIYYGAPGDVRPNIPGNPIGWSSDTSQITTTVIALDLNNDGVITITKKATGDGVLFDVDNDGFAEETDWIGPRDGILVLDRTMSGKAADGQIDSGLDLFNDGWVDGKKRGLTVLNEINSNNAVGNLFYGGGYGELDAADPVFSHLKVWLDINGDGVAQRSELQTLADLHIESLKWGWLYAPQPPDSYATEGRVVRTGMETVRLQSVNLESNAAGVATKRIGNSLLITKEIGGEEAYALGLVDYGLSPDAAVRASHTHVNGAVGLTAIDEVLDGQEDITITVSVEQLLKNDTATGGSVTFAGLVANSQTHGQVSFDADRRTVTFVPQANFNGVASFGYVVSNGQGGTVQATAYVDIGAIDDAPTVSLTGTTRPATWRDLELTSNLQGQIIYGLVPLLSNILVQAPADPTIDVKSLGYLGDSGTALLPDSVGLIGFTANRLYFAPLAEPGNGTTQMPWREVSIDVSALGAILFR